MLYESLERALEIGADRIELEWKDGKQWIFAYRGPLGAGIGSVDSNSDDSKQLFKEMDDLKKGNK